ncbi:MAG: shikimate kinase [Chitinophagaceae bacterium]|nr:MAG: shikimate kinase [Chitinophagaceae bacterium]
MRIYLLGFMGAGKSFWGKQLSKKLQYPLLDLDNYIEEQEGKTINNIFLENGEEYFRQLEQKYLQTLSQNNQDIIISCGGGTPCFFNNIDFMNEQGVTVWLNIPEDIILGRLRQNKQKRPLIKDLDDTALRQYIQKKMAERKMYYAQSKIKVDDAQIDLDKLVNDIENA